MGTWYIYQIPIRVQAYHGYYWKPLRHCRWLDSPRAFNFAKLRVQYCSMLFIASRSILLIPGKTMLNLLNDSELFWTTKILRHAAGLLTYRSFCSAFPVHWEPVTFKILNIGLRITAAGLCRNHTYFPKTEYGAKVIIIYNMAKRNTRFYYFFRKISVKVWQRYSNH